MQLRKFALVAGALTLSAPLTAESHVQPAVKPGGDIPKAFHRRSPPIPKGGDIPQSFTPPRAEFQYVRREVMIPMRDGVKLYAVLIIPRGAGKFPIMLDRTPYSADKATSRGSFGPLPENILSPLSAELVRAGYIVAFEDVRGKYKSDGDYVMNRPLRGPLNPTAVDHSTDAYDTIDWLVKNVPESNGRVGTIGTSYDGFTTLMSLVEPAPGAEGQRADQPDGRRVEGRRLVPQRRLPPGDDQLHLRPDRDQEVRRGMVQRAATTIIRPTCATARPAPTATRWAWSSCPSGGG